MTAAVARFGGAGFQIASSVTGIIAQRLIRRLCSCSKAVPASSEFRRQLELAGVSAQPSVQHLANGCESCDLTGYKGRVGIYEMLMLDDAIRAAVHDGSDAETIRGLVRRNGMRLMYEYAIEQVAAGISTLEEVERVVPIEQVKSTACIGCKGTLGANFLFCPYCGKPVAIETEGKPRSYDLADPIAVNE